MLLDSCRTMFLVHSLLEYTFVMAVCFVVCCCMVSLDAFVFYMLLTELLYCEIESHKICSIRFCITTICLFCLVRISYLFFCLVT